ncbi:hypothetical protein N7468_010086 [Penicillium chermesinum]|uniref:Polyketide cyclase/dehydrase n=1 Tax=Penicillium chermesinum TaxID=63820 RepID=A0A9W9NC23_9EURO|nr:uncharacterized protein N7468_010086 [Penicillium chermesinum]KAJ5217078.1 hypothetical protein N7468_010086 [Penicillium chermesinum]KAJ6171306.1 hypothetical protein N7470_000373 [Penicillium chermesinum]
MTSLTDPENTTRSTPNISAADATLHLGSSTFIAAPPSHVWEVLTDTSTWPAWNTFVPRVTIRSQPDGPAAAPLSPVLRAGTKITFHVCMDPAASKPQPPADTHLIVTEAVAPNPGAGSPGRIIWVTDPDAPGAFWRSLLNAERVHELKEVEGGTEVRNWECQKGYLVHVVKWMYGSLLRTNFQRWVEGLKAQAETGQSATE